MAYGSWVAESRIMSLATWREAMLSELQCSLLGHKIERKKVWHDGLDHRTSCARCGSPMIKHNQVWRPFDSDEDMDLRRKPHPHFHRATA